MLLPAPLARPVGGYGNLKTTIEAGTIEVRSVCHGT